MGDARSNQPGLRRRAVLAGAGGALCSTAGCVQRARNVLGRDSTSQLSLRILTLPTDANPFSARIARSLAENLRRCGIDAQIEPADYEAILRRVLINGDFDLYVGQFGRADWTDPDQLYSLLHSAYASESGWQNPFRYTDLDLDGHLETQRTAAGIARERAVRSIQRTIAETQPFTTLAFPDSLATVRVDRFRNWTGVPGDPLALLGVESAPTASASTLRVVTNDGRITANWNPLAVEFRNRGPFIDLLYDSLARRVDGERRPWLAADWTVERSEGLHATVDLREGAEWHDGKPIDAGDVAFTYRFLADTSLGSAETAVPSPQFRGRTSLVDSVSVRDDRTVRLSFAEAAEAVAERALTIPILPEHVWRERTDPATLAGLDANRAATEALIGNNPGPVGSGPLRFDSATVDQRLALSVVDDHFLFGSDPPVDVGGSLPYDELVVRVAGSDESAVELVASGGADATVSPLGPSVVPRIGRETGLRLLAAGSRAFYHVGYNTAEAPLSNTRFRQVVAGLIDKQRVVSDVFEGYAMPAASPMHGTDWLAPGLEWDGADPATPFFGERGDLDAASARATLADAGYQYRDGDLLTE